MSTTTTRVELGSSRSARMLEPNSAPPLLQYSTQMIPITFKLRDCEFIEFHKDLDKNSATVYDLMYAVSRYHGGTVYPDKVRIYMKVSEDEFRLIDDVSKKLSDYDNVEVFYYDYDPVSGSLLTIPHEASK